jgi:hypothetical protein
MSRIVAKQRQGQGQRRTEQTWLRERLVVRLGLPRLGHGWNINKGRRLVAFPAAAKPCAAPGLNAD